MDRDFRGGYVQAGFCLQRGARSALEGHFLETAGAYTAFPTLFWPRLLSQDPQMGGWQWKPPTPTPGGGGELALKARIRWLTPDSFPRLTGYHGEKMLRAAPPPPDSGAQTDPSPSPVPMPPREKQPPAQNPAVPAPDTAPPRPGARARRAHAPSRLTPRHLHKQGAKHPRAHTPGTRRHCRAASPQRLARARAHAATRGHTRGPLPPQGTRGRPSAPPRPVGAAPIGPLTGGGEVLSAPDTPPAQVR